MAESHDFAPRDAELLRVALQLRHTMESKGDFGPYTLHYGSGLASCLCQNYAARLPKTAIMHLREMEGIIDVVCDSALMPTELEIRHVS